MMIERCLNKDIWRFHMAIWCNMTVISTLDLFEMQEWGCWIEGYTILAASYHFLGGTPLIKQGLLYC